MVNVPSPFGRREDDDLFDASDEYNPDNLPDPGRFLDGHHVLTGRSHVEFHDLTHDLFEDRGVYDMTFNYNLARLNLDTRHPGAGFRYAEDAHHPNVLRAEFTPTTPFCPQTNALTVASFRAWNAASDRHEYELVRTRTTRLHHRSDQINASLSEMEGEFRETGNVSPASPDGTPDV